MNAYEIKTRLDRNRISSLMDAETWMNANKAVELGFADGILDRDDDVEDVGAPDVSAMYSKVKVTNSLRERIAAKCKIDHIDCNEKSDIVSCGRSANDIRERLDFIKRFI